MAIEKFKLKLLYSKMVTPNILHLNFLREDEKALDFIPGQFITFLFTDQDGKIRRRSYSVSSIPNETNEIEIAISYLKNGIASENLFHMQEGETFEAIGPAGRLILRDEKVRKLILAGTGTGIAPYRAMLPQIDQMITQQHFDEVHILLGAQKREDALYQSDFLRYEHKNNKIHFHLCLSREKTLQKPYEQKGYIQTHFKAFNLLPEEDVIYLCGNPNMVDEAYQLLLKDAFDIKRIRREKYVSSN